jgi:hypothetical protein
VVEVDHRQVVAGLLQPAILIAGGVQRGRDLQQVRAFTAE